MIHCSPISTVLHHLGSSFERRLRAAFPDVDVVAVAPEGPLDDGVGGDVLATTAIGCANLAELCARGVTWVHALGTGVDRFPFDALPISTLLTCTRGASAVPIAEYVLAAMLDFEKRLDTLFVREPPTRWAVAHLGGLRGRTVSIVGMGGIGTEIARRCLAFDMHVLAVRRSSQPPPFPEIRVVALDDALAAADHLVLATPSTPSTRHLIDEAAIGLLRPGAHLVNIARGTLVDQDALRRALEAGTIARASLDVCDPEPLPDGHWMYAHPNIRLSPHVSWITPGAIEDLQSRFVDNFRRWRAGQPLDGLVDRVERY